MARNKKQHIDVAAMQPDELNVLKVEVVEFVKRLENLDNEIACLRDDKKQLKEDFADKLDVPTLDKVLRVLKVESDVKHRHTYDCFMEVLREHDSD